MFWTDWGKNGNARIVRSWMDGTHIQHAFIRGSYVVNKPISLTIDDHQQRIFWADSGRNTIMSATLDGHSRKILVHGAHPLGLSIYKVGSSWCSPTSTTPKALKMLKDVIYGEGGGYHLGCNV